MVNTEGGGGAGLPLRRSSSMSIDDNRHGGGVANGSHFKRTKTGDVKFKRGGSADSLVG